MAGWKNVEAQRAYLAPRLRRWYPTFITGGEQYRRLLWRNVTPSTILLDAGTGDGGYIREFRGRVKKIIGVDVHQELLSKNVSVDEKIVADLEHIPVPDNSVDIIAAEFVLEHLEDPESVFQEWRRILRPGGKILCLTSNLYNPIMLFSYLTPLHIHRWLKRRLLKKTEHVHLTWYRANTKKKITSLAKKTNLKVSTIVQAGNPEYLALHSWLVVPAILLERLQTIVGLRWLQMYLVVEIEPTRATF